MADLLLCNGVVHTMDPHRPRATSVAVRDGRVLAVGADQELAGTAEGAVLLDLRGRCVVPGLVDAHVHFELWSLARQQVDAEASSLEEVLRRVGARVQRAAPGTWILGWGWNQNRWGDEFPVARALDRVAPAHPVFLRAKSGHAGWANTCAMQKAGVDRATADPPGGRLLRAADGEPAGVFLEAAQELIDRAIPEPSVEEVAAAMAEGQQHALELGLTGVHDLDGARALRAWQLLRERGQLSLRVHKAIPASRMDEALALGLRTGLGDAWLRLGGVKLFADGALGPRTAWMLDPYDEEPANAGLPLLEPPELEARIRRADAGGLAVLVHAIGDRANRLALDILARIRAEGPAAHRPLRHRLEHVQLLDPSDQRRLSALGVVASMQPIHATSDMEIAERYWGRRCSGAYAWRSLLDAGTALAFGSDAPVEPIAPLAGIHAAVTRRRADGSPGAEGWRPEQRLSVLEALRAYTAGAAWAAGSEAETGALVPGNRADLVVLDRDPLRVPPMEILDVRVVATLVGGRWAYADPAFERS